jgi:hypothetical protein
MAHDCKYCKSIFKNKYTLNKHLDTAKYCLQLRGITKLNFECNDCEKFFSRKHHLTDHMKICVKKVFNEVDKNTQTQIQEKDRQILELKYQLQEQKQTIKDLQDKLENIALKAVSRPTTSTVNKTQINNFIQNMESVTSDHLLEQSSNLTIEHVQKGASGYAEYALEYPLKDRVACVDYARRKLKFKDNKGDVVADPEMVKLAPMFFDSIQNKSSEIVYNMNKDNMDSAMFEGVAQLFNTNSDVKNGAIGIKSDFYHDFVKHVCSASVLE